MSRGVTIRCTICGLEVTGAELPDGRVVPHDRTRPEIGAPAKAGRCWTHADIEADPEPVPDSIADIAAEAGVTEAQLRQALREVHPDASVAEVMLAAREVER